MEPKWLTWGKELQAISQNGLAYSKDNQHASLQGEQKTH